MVGDRVAGVLPALVGQTLARARFVVDEAVTVMVGDVVDPAQRAFDVASQLVEEREVACPADVLGQQADEERRRVDRSVVGGLGHFVEVGLLVDPQLVQDFAWLLVAPFVVAAALVLRQQKQRVGGDASVVGERL